MYTGDYTKLGDFLLHESAHRNAGSSIIAFDARSFHCLDGENWKFHSSCTSMGLRRWEFPIKIILCKHKSLNIIYGTLEGYSIFKLITLWKGKQTLPKVVTRHDPSQADSTQVVQLRTGSGWLWSRFIWVKLGFEFTCMQLELDLDWGH